MVTEFVGRDKELIMKVEYTKYKCVPLSVFLRESIKIAIAESVMKKRDIGDKDLIMQRIAFYYDNIVVDGLMLTNEERTQYQKDIDQFRQELISQGD